MIIYNDLLYNIIQDFSKKHIDNNVKSDFIKQILIDENISERELARRLRIPHSTLHDWTSNRQMKKYYKNKRDEVYFYADRLIFLLSKHKYTVDERTKNKLLVLNNEISKIN